MRARIPRVSPVRWPAAALAVLLLVGAFLSGLAARIATYSHASCTTTEEVAIVLGAAVWGTRPSPVFEERIRHAITLYQAGQVSALVFTGGVGTGDEQAESDVARDYAIARGVPAGRIYVEQESQVTYENLLGAARILKAQGWSSAAIVSDPLHMRRAVTMARDLGIDACPSPTPTTRYRTWRTQTMFLVRETLFYAGYLIHRAAGL